MPRVVNLVVIDGKRYSFYRGKEKIVAIESGNMTKEYLEYYRRNPEKILGDAQGETDE